MKKRAKAKKTKTTRYRFAAVRFGRIRNLGNYENARAEVEVVIPAGGSLKAAFAKAKKEVQDLLGLPFCEEYPVKAHGYYAAKEAIERAQEILDLAYESNYFAGCSTERAIWRKAETILGPEFDDVNVDVVEDRLVARPDYFYRPQGRASAVDWLPEEEA